MKTFWVVLLTAALACGLASFLGGDGEETYDGLPADETPEDTPPTPPGAAPLTTGVLTVTVRTSHGAAPPESTAGYAFGRGERLRKVDVDGRVRFSDVPLGWVTIVAHAPGYEDGTMRKYLSSGVPVDLVIVLKHADDVEAGKDDPEVGEKKSEETKQPSTFEKR